VDYSIFMMQVAMKVYPGNAFRSDLHELIRNAPEHATYNDKFFFYRAFSQRLLDAVSYLELGIWEYFDDTDKALSQFADWTDSLEVAREARYQPIPLQDSAYRGAPQDRYLIACFALLLQQNSPTDVTLRARCNVPADRLWKREIFAHHLKSVPLINFASVRSDLVFLLPGRDDHALTHEDLQAPHYHYLRPLT
jgi:hypothetical protein